MLNLMRKHASSWMIKVVLFAIVIVFVFWGFGSMRSQKATQVADVNGETITLDVYRKAYYQLLDYYRRIYGGQIDDNFLKMLKPNEMALNQIIDRVLQRQEAERLKLKVSDEELAQSIYKISAFQVNGAFNKRRYEQILAQNNISDEAFRMDRGEELLLNKLRAVVINGITVTEDDAKEWYNWSKSKVSIEYVLFSPDRYKDIKLTDEQVQSFFKEHKDNYRTEPEAKVRYIHFDPEKYKPDVQITDKEIAEYYEGHPEEFKTEKRVKARHILIETDEKNVENKKNEAMKIYEIAKSGKDFAKLAKQHSEGPSKDQGGDLGWFTRDKMVKPFADKAFSMTKDDISEPVHTNFGWHIIKVEQIEEAKTRNLEEATEDIKTKLNKDAAKSIALEKAESLYDSVYDGDDLSEAGKSHKLQVHETDFFTASAGPKEKEIIQAQQFAQTAFSLDKMAISEIQDFSNGYFILQVSERKDSEVPDFDQVDDRVRADAVKEQQEQRAKADAEAFLADVQKGKTFAEGSAQIKIESKVTGFFERNGAIPDIGNESTISQAAFNLTKDKPIAEKAIKGSKGWFVIRYKERNAPDNQGFSTEKASIIDRLTEQKRQATYQAWLEDLKSRSKIDTNKKLIQEQ